MKYNICFLLSILCIHYILNADIITVSDVYSLQSAIGELKSNDTILIENGIYNIENTLVINNKTEKIFNVAIIGKSGKRDSVRIYSSGMGVYSETAPHVFAVYNVENLLFQDLTAGRTYWHPITVQGNAGCDIVYFKNLHLIDAGEQFIKINNKEEPKCDNGVVEGCLIEYTDYPYWDGDSYYTQGVDKIGGGDNWIVRDCIFKNIRPHPDHLDAADGAGAPITFWQGGTNNLIERNTIINCRKGIELGISDGTGVANSIVRNNFIYREQGMVGGDIGISVNDSPDSKIYNNTVILNNTFNPGSGAKAIEFRFKNSTNLEIKNNLCDGDIWERVSEMNTEISNNIYNVDESWFVDAENYDLHLISTALDAIDNGLTLNDVTDDIDKQARPVNGLYDIGADEFTSGETSVLNSAISNFSISVYPNPVTEFFIINYHLSIPSKVKIDIYNSIGNNITTLCDAYQEAGNYYKKFSVGTIQSFPIQLGFYHFLFRVNGECILRKFIYVK
ncbi:MAG: hypothetical protein EPN82_15485 [Bacteroidetes bacterium]|nr:MAG: hypothetical protein EPN82_15485 [Bacteroidota bacterium]